MTSQIAGIDVLRILAKKVLTMRDVVILGGMNTRVYTNHKQFVELSKNASNIALIFFEKITSTIRT